LIGWAGTTNPAGGHLGGPPKAALEVIAARIIAAAKLGVRDPVRLRAAALAQDEKD